MVKGASWARGRRAGLLLVARGVPGGAYLLGDGPNGAEARRGGSNLERFARGQAFVGTDDYKAHKEKRFRRGDNPNIAENEAFVLSDPPTRETYKTAYAGTSALYYKARPPFEEILEEVARWAKRL